MTELSSIDSLILHCLTKVCALAGICVYVFVHSIDRNSDIARRARFVVWVFFPLLLDFYALATNQKIRVDAWDVACVCVCVCVCCLDLGHLVTVPP
jgi:hypothetical protein